MSIYFLTALIVSMVMTLRSGTRCKFATMVISFWILGASIVNEKNFDIPVNLLGAHVQIQQLVFILLLCHAIVLLLTRERQQSIIHFPFEKYLVAFVILFIVVNCYHWSNGVITPRQLRGRTEGILMILLLYWTLKRNGDREMIAVIGKSVLVLAICTSIVAIIQFFIDPHFLRVGSMLGAFAGRYRSNGVFSAEYDQSYFLVIALMFVMLWGKSIRYRSFLIALFAVGIALTFHRMSWIAALVAFTIYLAVIRRRQLWKIVTVSAVVIFSFYVIASEIFPIASEVEHSSVYRSRLSADTMSDRLEIYRMVLGRIDQLLICGVGSSSSSVYYSGMMSIGMGSEWALGEHGGIHNGYLEILFFYGMPVLLLFCAVLVSIILSFRKLVYQLDHRLMLAILFAVIYGVMNLTNSFPPDGYFGMVMGLVLGSSAVNYRLYLRAGVDKMGPGA